MILEYHRLAQRDARDALDYFEIRGIKPASEFRDELRAAYARIRANPTSGSPIYRRYRFIKLATYRYTVYYEVIEAGRVKIYAVAHDSRRPGYWTRRARNP